jgi:uncharacterized repeat protein (TIGR01451 family)
LGFAVVLVSLWALASQADAVLPANCSQSGQVVTCTFSATGAEQSFGVPAGVSSVQVTAVGGAGGGEHVSGQPSGGVGAVVSGSVSVAAPQTLYVEVGGVGGDPNSGQLAPAFNGGGLPVDPYASGGGGASDVRKVSCGSPCVTTDPASLSSRQLIAAGGGGAGADGLGVLGGAGGLAGTAGSDGAAAVGGEAGGGGGGQPGLASQGGSGGSGGTAPPPFGDPGLPGVMGGDGSLGQGGVGGDPHIVGGGGGGGGGLYGGGGGGSGGFDALNGGIAGGGGGGGGSSSGGSIGVSAPGAAPSVTISYTVPPPPTCQPVSTSTPAGQAVTVQLNCTDSTGAGLNYAIVSGPSHGTLGTINPSTGQVVYTPNSGFSGPDSFTYKASSSNGMATAQTVSIQVTPVTPPGADLTVALSVAPGQVHYVSPVIYTATVTNQGPAAASAVQLKDTLPFGVRSLVVFRPAGWSCTTPPIVSSGTITCKTASLASGASATFHFVVVNLEHRGGSLRDSATVSATTTDPNPANNQATITTKVS